MVRRGGKLIAVIPGGLVGPAERPIFASPLGASVGGPAVSASLNTEDLLDLIAALQRFAHSKNWAGIEMVLPPGIYQSAPSDALEFALFFHGFRQVNRWLCPIIPITGDADGRYAQLFRARFATRVRAGGKMGIRVERGGLELLQPFTAVFDETYRRHGAKPTHDTTEIADLLRRLPDRVQLYVALADDVPVAGLFVLLLNPRIAYSFYICTSTAHAREPGGVVVFASAIDSLGAAGYRWLDLGPTAKLGNFDAGITQFKEGLGGIGHCRDKWSWSIAEERPSGPAPGEAGQA